MFKNTYLYFSNKKISNIKISNISVLKMLFFFFSLDILRLLFGVFCNARNFINIRIRVYEEMARIFVEDWKRTMSLSSTVQEIKKEEKTDKIIAPQMHDQMRRAKLATTSRYFF